MHPRTAHGFTLIELLIALVLAVIVIGSLGTVAFTADNDRRVGLMQQQIGIIVRTVANAYPPSAGSYAGLTTASIAASLPGDMWTQSGGAISVTNPWGGNYQVNAADFAAPGDNGEYQITVSGGIPRSECVPAARDVGDSFNQVSVNGTVVKAGLGTSTWVTPSALTAACGANASPVIVFTKV